MPKNKSNVFNVDDLLNSLFPVETLSEMFEKRIKELNIAPTTALEIIDIEYRALQGILQGTSKQVDNTNFIKLASFLKLPNEKIFSLYLKALEKNFPEVSPYSQDKIDYINANFDLATLRKIGFIKSITDYQHIEEKINSHFGLKTIFEFKLPSNNVAFSAGLTKPKNLQTRGLWVESARTAFEVIANPHEYNKAALAKYFPEIRWKSTNVELGLLSVIRDLYTLGVTVFYQDSISINHLKGATIVVNQKPCIVLTDYKGFYSTLWHTLIHELYHVLFDFELIKNKKYQYHLSDIDTLDLGDQDLGLWEKEKEADGFAREFLFSKEKSNIIKPHINNKKFVADFAEMHQIHPSFIYTYYAFDNGKEDKQAWAKAKKFNPSFDEFIKLVENPWDKSKPTAEHINFLKQNSILYK
ncbi:ImmA/IrrE family metallo-endopeptidase [Adhaeribacter soli]|uniref:ImmA/IrrE family metallo-endopeptidase n=1 Tax=Adhaeribacter soli TaxID=2607655 RepID=A0A5N1IY04_9BACT|nr:hypothetical protein [Adhaeribacter soli]KAA9338807.1 hypothetical protein F0P94_08405 [Adhaeribacter soli]